MKELSAPVCADCVAFVPQDLQNRYTCDGRCLLRRELDTIPANLDHCELFKIRESRIGIVDNPKPSKAKRAAGGRSMRDRDEPKIVRRTLQSPIEGDSTGDIDMDREGLKSVLRELLEEETMYGYPQMGSRWQDGKLVLHPHDENNQPKEIPLESFFHKIVMLRDRLRVLEAKLNSHKKLSEQEKVEFQGYISKCYGTLTTFNVLFADKEDQFRSK